VCCVAIRTLSKYDNAFKFFLMAAILNLIQPEIVPFDPPTSKTPPRTKHEVDRMIRCTVAELWTFEILNGP